MKEKVTGKCHCGNISYELDGPKQFEFLCHCTDCRKINSGGHLSGAIFNKDLLSVKGETKEYSYDGGSGKPIVLNFCPNCSTSLFAYPNEFPDVVVIRANTFDDPELFNPKASLFPASAFHWDRSVIQK